MGTPFIVYRAAVIVPSSSLHRAEEHDVIAVVQDGVTLRLFTVETDGDLVLGRNADHGEQIGDGGAGRQAVGLWTLMTVRQKATQVGEEGNTDGDRLGAGLVRGHTNTVFQCSRAEYSGSLALG